MPVMPLLLSDEPLVSIPLDPKLLDIIDEDNICANELLRALVEDEPLSPARGLVLCDRLESRELLEVGSIISIRVYRVRPKFSVKRS